MLEQELMLLNTEIMEFLHRVVQVMFLEYLGIKFSNNFDFLRNIY